MSSIDISIVIPVYNSSASLQELQKRISAAMEVVGKSYELILVDDGSRDGSWKELKKVKEVGGNTVTAVRLEKNVGQHNAILCGFGLSRGNVIITMDDDLQHPPEEIAKLLSQYEESQPDVVYGIYKVKEHGRMRSAGSFIVQKSSKYFADYKGGVGSSFRLFNREIVDKIKGHPQSFVFIDEIIHWYTGDIDTVEVEHHPRKEGKSSYTLFKLTRLYFNILINYTAWPLKFMIYGGMLASLFSFFIGVFYIVKKVFYNVDVEGFTALIVAITFSSSLILMSLGIIGQYLYKIYQQQNGKPPYSINKVL
ncbi:MAG: undecaprenyl-phosphate 4-deoxy-4-formamido-L-arabinose transferase [Crocinitomicaceae bacterium]|jgi:undecaprenyl-phosphate 4-deoxy-4-formamido-L-arabinose transferase